MSDPLPNGRRPLPKTVRPQFCSGHVEGVTEAGEGAVGAEQRLSQDDGVALPADTAAAGGVGVCVV